MTRALIACFALAVLSGCGHPTNLAATSLTGTTASTRAIGCLPGDCPGPRPTIAPCHNPRPLSVKAIGCLPGDCPGTGGTPKPCR